MVVVIDTRRIDDEATFHEVFFETFGFANWYGRNMDAWIDCMTNLDDSPDNEFSQVNCPAGEMVVLQLLNTADFSARQPALFQNLLDCSAFVNWRRIEAGGSAILVLSYCK